MSSTLRQCAPLSLELSICKHKRIFWEIIETWSINLFIWFEGKAPTNLSSISSSIIFLNTSSVWKLVIPLAFFFNQGDYLDLFFCLFTCFFNYVSVCVTVTFLCNCTCLSCCFLGPIRLVCLTVTFLGKFPILVLSYLATKLSLLGNVTCLGVARLRSIIVSLIVFFFFFHPYQNLI